MKKLLLVTTALVAAAGPAHAGPVMGAVAWVGGILGGSAGAVAAFAMNAALSMGLSAISMALAPKPKGPAASVSFDVKMGDDLPLSFIVGDYATAGKRKYLESWGKNTRFITEVIEVSALPQGFAAMWVNDEPGQLTAGRRGYVSAGAQPAGVSSISEAASVPAGSLDIGQPLGNLSDDGNRIWVKWIDGTQTAADPFLVWAFGGRTEYAWTSDMVGRGKSYAIVTTRYDGDSLTNYPSYLFQPAPLPLYDLRFDSTNGGSGSQRWNDRSTWQPTRNNAVAAYNVARGIYYGNEWVYGGKNLPAWRLPQAEWIAAANACDATVARASGGTEPRYRCGLEITVDAEPASVLEEIGKGANMKFAEVGGRLKPIVDLPGAAVFSITDGDILITEGQSFTPFYPVAETYNVISATYPERAEKWASKDAPIYIDTEAQAADGGRYLPTSMTYGAVPFGAQVQRLMRSQMRDFRRMRQHQFYLPPDAYALEPGIDLVSYSSERNGYINKQFMVERVSKTPGMNVLVSLREVDPSDYDWSSDFEQPITITPPVNPVPYVQPIGGFAAVGMAITDSSGRGRHPAVRVSCNGDEVGVTHIRIQVRKGSTGEPYLDIQRPFGSPFVWNILDVVQQTTYQVRARLVSDLTPRGEWTAWHTATTPAIYVDNADFVGGISKLFRDQGMYAIEYMASLPAAGAFVGQLVFNTTTGKLHRWTGTAWVEVVQGALQGALDETNFAQGISVPRVVSALPTTGNYAGRLVVLSTDGRLYRWTAGAWTAEVAADQVVGKLTAAQIAAGAIGVDQLAAGAVVASKMAITDFTNLVPDDQMQDAASWTINATGNVTHFPTHSSASIQSRGLFRIDAAGANLTQIVGKPSAAKPGDEFFFSGQIFSAGNADPRVCLQFLDKDGGSLSVSVVAGAGAGFRILTGSAVAPAGTMQVRLYYVFPASSYGADYSYVAAPVVRLKNKGELIVDGTITGNKIVANTITGGLLATSGIITTAAQITGAVIQNAHIENLTIGPDKIQIDGLSRLWSGSFAKLATSTNNTWSEVGRITFTPYAAGSKILVIGSALLSVIETAAFVPVGIMRVLINGTEVFRRALTADRKTGGGSYATEDWISIVAMGTAIAGANAAVVQVIAGSDDYTASLDATKLFVTEFKR